MTTNSEYEIVRMRFGQIRMIEVMKWLNNRFGLALRCTMYYIHCLPQVWLPLTDRASIAALREEAAPLNVELKVVSVTHEIYAKCCEQVKRDNQLHQREQDILRGHQRTVRQLTEYLTWEMAQIVTVLHYEVSVETREIFAYLHAGVERFKLAQYDAAAIDLRRFQEALDGPGGSTYELDAMAHRQTASYLLAFALDRTGRPREADAEWLAIVERYSLCSDRRWHLMCREVMRRLSGRCNMFLKYREVTGVSVPDGPPNFELEPPAIAQY